MKKLVLLIVFLLLLNFASAQECAVPKEGMEIVQDTLFCHGEYNLDKGIMINNDNIVLNCNNASLIGNGLGYGIILKNKENVIVSNCNITNYEVGIYLDDSDNNNVVNNYLSKNRFGIVLFSSENNFIEDNVIEHNSRSNEIEFFLTRLFIEPTDQVVEAEVPEIIFENALKARNPELTLEEISFEIENIFNKYFNLTQDNLEINRIYFFNDTEGSTRVILRLVPKIPLSNVSVYESIPKCMSSLASDILFEDDNYEIVKEDPLIIWGFAVLDVEEEVSYKIFKEIDDDCRELLMTFGIATGFNNKENQVDNSENNYDFFNIALLFLVSLMVVFIFIVFLRLRRSQGQS